MKHLDDDTLQRVVDLTGFDSETIMAVHTAIMQIREEEIDYLFSRVTE